MDAIWTRILPRGTECLTALVSAAPTEKTRRGEYGEPLWPNGTVGSITHAGGFRTVATAPADRISALGIDMEPLVPLPTAVWQRIFDTVELDEVLALPAPQRGLAALERWCLKEALFKALRGHTPLERLALRRAKGTWELAPSVCKLLEHDGLHAPQRLIFCSESADGWQYAAAWYTIN